jgi:hypothetical protein
VDQPGFLYAVQHLKNYPGLLKIGKAKNPSNRLTSYQVGCPYRGYSIAFVLAVPEYSRAELQAHRLLDGFRIPNTEWFAVSVKDAMHLLSSIDYSEDE